LNKPKLCVLHRYPITQAIETNPSLYDFLKIMTTNGFGIRFVSFSEEKNAQRTHVEIPPGVEIVALPFTLRRNRPLDKYLKSVLFLFLTPFIARVVRQDERILGVYCDDSLPFYGYLVKKLTNRRVILRLGDLQTGYMLSGRSAAYDAVFKLLHRIEVHTWKAVDGLATISRPFEDYVRRSGVTPDRILTIPESVDTQEFHPIDTVEVRVKFGIPSDCVLLMFHGVIEPLKGLDILLDNLSKLDSSLLNKVKLMIIGNGGSIGDLRKRASDLGLDDEVIWVGWVPFKMMPQFINACDVGVPMRSANFANNFVVTLGLLQYWACGKPVLAPRLKAISAIVHDGENGETYDPRKPSEFSEKIRLLMTERTSRLDEGREGRRLVCEAFDKSVVAQALYLGVTRLLSAEKQTSWTHFDSDLSIS